MGKLTDLLKPSEGYKKNKSLEKLLFGVLGSIIISGITYIIQQIEIANIDPKYTLLAGLGVACLYGAKNAVKHWKDSEVE